MGSTRYSGALWRFVLLTLCVEGCSSGAVDTEESITAVLGLDVQLPCRYRPHGTEKVTQVSWFKTITNGNPFNFAILNTEYGAHVETPYKGRVKELSPLVPNDGSIMLKNAVQADEGTYRCLFNTFPAGSFEASLKLSVLVPPLPSLNPGPPLMEGQGNSLAASCTAEGNPEPNVSWETEVKGKDIATTSTHPRSVSVTSEFYVVPHHSMNGKTLTCVISHPGLQEQKRIVHVLRVGYLSDASLQGQEEDWFVGREGATLQCLIEGHPPPAFNWTRVNSTLPKGVKTEDNKLVFQSPLAFEDGGVYICQANNGIATRQTRASINIADAQRFHTANGEGPALYTKGSETQRFSLVSVSIMSVAVIAGVLLAILLVAMILVSRYHRRKTKQLSEKIEELSVLSRENSRRHLGSNSASVDRRSQIDESLPMRSGLHPDSLRDMSNSSMTGEEVDRRSYSTLTTVREIETQTELLSSAVPSQEVQEEQEEQEGQELLGDEEHNEEEHKEEESEREVSSFVENETSIKQAMDNFYPENGMLRIKPTANGIYINGRGHLV